jgi:hypothetical protein
MKSAEEKYYDAMEGIKSKGCLAPAVTLALIVITFLIICLKK